MAQWVKNLPAMQETQEMLVQSLGWVDPLEEEMASHSCLKYPLDREDWWATVQRVTKSQTQLSDGAHTAHPMPRIPISDPEPLLTSGTLV